MEFYCLYQQGNVTMQEKKKEILGDVPDDACKSGPNRVGVAKEESKNGRTRLCCSSSEVHVLKKVSEVWRRRQRPTPCDA
jgi:hypothetical protein